MEGVGSAVKGPRRRGRESKSKGNNRERNVNVWGAPLAVAAKVEVMGSGKNQPR